MKTKTYVIESISKGMYFCPNCHRELLLPFKGSNVNIQGGIALMCSNCNKGKIVITLRNPPPGPEASGTVSQQVQILDKTS
jgi:RNase P subunit RPR2